MKKIVLVAYSGDPICFSHVMLYALDFADKGYEVSVIIEGAATGLIKELGSPASPFALPYQKLREQGLIGCICKACAMKMGSYEAAVEQGILVGSELHGHPSLEPYLRDGYEVLTF